MSTETQYQGWPWLSAYEKYPRLGDARPVIGEFGMVSAPHHQASLIGLEILRAGGNAVDAAIATSAALMVTLPMQCSPGGDAIWLIKMPGGAVEALDASGRAPAKADAAALRRDGMRSIGHRSALSVTVPGAVDGWVQALKRHGTMPLGELLEPAARLAEEGFFVSRHIHASFLAALPVLQQWQSMPLWSADQRVPRLYDRLKQPKLATFLRAVGKSEGRALYEGAVADEIAETVTAGGGLLSRDDLANHRSDWVEPLHINFRRSTIYTSPPATQGVALLQALGMIERLSPEALNPMSSASAHLMIEAASEALADRDAHVTDRDRLRVDPRTLYGESHIAMAARRVDPDRTRPRERSTASTKGMGDTAHLAVVDKNHGSVSLIQSLYFDFGSGIPVQSGGFTLQNRGAAFSLEEGSLKEFKGGARPPHTLTPSLILKGNEVSHVIGCMGGDGQVQTQLQLLVDMIDAGLDPQQAVSRPRWYLDRADEAGLQVLVEEGIEAEILQGLRQRGHRVSVLGPAEEIMGHAQVIAIEPSGALVGAADRRSDGQAIGW
jgi:gamma-glutamyltranspeptidase/glutathione hydrolase